MIKSNSLYYTFEQVEKKRYQGEGPRYTGQKDWFGISGTSGVVLLVNTGAGVLSESGSDYLHSFSPKYDPWADNSIRLSEVSLEYIMIS